MLFLSIKESAFSNKVFNTSFESLELSTFFDIIAAKAALTSELLNLFQKKVYNHLESQQLCLVEKLAM